MNPAEYPNHSIKDGILFYIGQACLPHNFVLQLLILAEYHNNPTGGHTRAHQKLAWITCLFFGLSSGRQLGCLFENIQFSNHEAFQSSGTKPIATVAYPQLTLGISGHGFQYYSLFHHLWGKQQFWLSSTDSPSKPTSQRWEFTSKLMRSSLVMSSGFMVFK